MKYSHRAKRAFELACISIMLNILIMIYLILIK